MDIDQLLEDYEKFLNEANTNLGRKESKKRKEFIEEALEKVTTLARHANAGKKRQRVEHMKILGGHKKPDKSQKSNTYVMTEGDFKRNED